ncbi:two-component system, chemotaxis family, sensor kinase CheA [Geoalkalibacter ferrihydriticus]|uniref:Chemotaxis protein CheA n=1 Tax=Geoalkalibacter ferrihydriticus TaxID=392333 RepID=A0A1G9MYP0_9BACT|nr:chemotaxis protein CheA [Geoalkalibacter ferrihydriticus]SDL79348.1 two-component system, chemotaxis family, sensor kinase CheA [Geoalkalibacter ferrihydriticus]
MDMSRYRTLFFSEAREHLSAMGRLLVALEKNGEDPESIDALFREAHSVKGMAAAMGFERTAELSHVLEDMLDSLRQVGRLPADGVDRLLAGVDLLEGLVADLEAQRPERDISAFLKGNSRSDEPPPVAILPTPSTAEEVPLRDWLIHLELAPGTAAPAARLLLIYNRIAGLGRIASSTPDAEALRGGRGGSALKLQLRSRHEGPELEELLGRLGDFALLRVQRPRPQARPPAQRQEEQGRTVRVRTELLDQFINLAGEMITGRHRLQAAHRGRDWQDLGNGIDGMARLVTDLHHHVLKVRMMPLGSITGHLPRLVRDLARKNGKDVAFSISGDDLELDRAILEELTDPLMHMLRNAVDHGIEKSGRVEVRAAREKDMALIEVIDDGRGMDPEALRNKAVSAGLLSASQARALRDADALQLVCRPGFSTAAAVTSISGRGVGMDVVKNKVETLGGSLEISSRLGAGTRMALRLPLSVAIIQVLLVECDGCSLGIPLTRVVRLLNLTRAQIQSSGRRLVTRLDDEMLPLLSLRKILHRPAGTPGKTLPVVVAEVHGRRIGLVVDGLAGQRQVFVKALAFPLNRMTGVTGASILGDGRLLFIIDPQLLLQEQPSPNESPVGVSL